MLIIAASIFLVLLCGYLILQNDKLQQKVVKTITVSLSEKVNSNVSLKQIEWSFPNGFILKDVYIEDQNRDTLLSIERTKVTLNILELLQSKVSFRTIQMKGMEAHISKNKSNKYNFQFFVDAFQKEEKDSSKIKWSMDVESIAFDDCSVYYHKEGYTAQKNHFDPNDLGISSLNGYLHVKCFTGDSINIKLHNISFEEKSGLTLSGLSTTFLSNKDKMCFNNFVAKLPNSRLSLNEATLYHDNYKAFNNFVKEVDLSIDIAPSKVSMRDLSAFVPAFGKINDDISVEGIVCGRVSKLLISDLNVRYGENTNIKGNIILTGLPLIKDLQFKANLNEICTKPKDISEIANIFSKKEIKLPKFLNSLGKICYSGKIKGTVTDIEAFGSLSSDIGTIANNVTIKADDLGYNKFSINGNVASKTLMLSKIFGKESGLGNASFKLDVDVNKKGNDLLLDAKGKIDSLVFRKYTYNNILINGKFENKAFNGNIALDDNNAKVEFLGTIDFNKTKPSFLFQANVKDAQLYALHLTKTPNTTLSFEVETNFEGNTIDDLEGAFSIDNIIFQKEKKSLLVNNVSLTANKSEDHIKTLKLYSDYINGTLKG
ncbi:MAG: AsmA family protein, partial [Prevotellaceae bacterium]|nr:AsmA family protein [Prevotellaceae bacterium]